MKVLNVFVNENGNYGNPVGIIVDTKRELDNFQRQQLAVKSGFSEIVFINDIENRNISIYSPQNEIPFAGHAVVGAAYFLSEEYKTPINNITSIAGTIETWKEGNHTWAQCKIELTPPWNYEQLTNSNKITELTLEQMKSKEHTFVWAWLDETKGIVRARTFASDWDIKEDEANGSGSMKLAYLLKRNLTILHGKGSIIHAKYIDDSETAVGGIVKML